LLSTTSTFSKKGQEKQREKGANPQDSFIDIANYAEATQISSAFQTERIGDSIAKSFVGQHF
jgi:hypothetical protein